MTIRSVVLHARHLVLHLRTTVDERLQLSWVFWFRRDPDQFIKRVRGSNLNMNNRWRCDLPKCFFALNNQRIIRHSCNFCNFCLCKIVAVVLYQCTSSPGLDFEAVHLMKFKIQIKSIAKSSTGRTIFQWQSHQLKSFAQPRINLSPFTKDFRVRGTQIEHNSNFSQLPSWKP